MTERTAEAIHLATIAALILAASLWLASSCTLARQHLPIDPEARGPMMRVSSEAR